MDVRRRRRATRPSGRRTHADVFDAIAFGHGETPGAAAPAAAERPPAALDPSRRRHRALDDFTSLGTTGGYLSADEFLGFVHDAENGVKERGMFEGRGPLAILLIVLVGGLALNLTPCVLPMIPINLAIIGAGAQAGSRGRGFLLGARVRRRDGARLRRARPRRHPHRRHVRHDQLVAVVQPRHRRAVRRPRRSRCSTCITDRLLAVSSSRVHVGDRAAARSLLAFSMGARRGAAGRRLRRAGRHSGRAVLEQSLRDRHTRRARAAVLSSASAWRCRGRSPAPASRRCRSPGMWMVRVKQAFGVFILATAAYYGYEAYRSSRTAGSIRAAVDVEREEKLKAGWHASLAEGSRSRSASRSRC